MDAQSQQNQGVQHEADIPVVPNTAPTKPETVSASTTVPPLAEQKTEVPKTKQQDYINSLYSEIDTSYNQAPKSERTWLTQKQQGPLKALRTYQGDIEANISQDNTSLTKMVVMEQAKKQSLSTQSKVFSVTASPQHTEPNEKGKKIFFITLGTLLILLGTVSLSSFYFIQNKKEIAIEEQRGALVNFHRKVTVPIKNDRSVLISTIDAEKKAKNTFNSIVYIDTITTASSSVEKTADISDVISLIGPNMPPSLKRSFVGLYMIGIYPFDLNHPFIILKTKDFTSSYAGMLKWEPMMTVDIKSLFGITTVTGDKFEDEIYRNKDLRVLRDDKGNIVLLYSFIDRETLIITTNELLFNTLLGKYNVTQRIQ